jgi:hypothetical protein
MVDQKNDHNEPIPEPQKVERTPEKTVGEAKAHELRPEEVGKGPGASSSKGGGGSGGGGSKPPKPELPKRPALFLAEFDTAGGVIHAAEKLRDAGYSKFDAHSPFPVHGMDKAMGLPDSRLGWIVLACGLTGTTAAFAMMYWMNGIDYPIIIGGKPGGAFPSMVPIMFEVTVLFSALSTVFGMFHLNRLPRHHHPIFYSDRFKAFSDDKFFVSVEAEDPKFDTTKTRALLESAHPAAIELVHDEEEES